MAYHKGGILVFLTVWFHYSQSSSLSVPLLTWSNNDATKLPSVTAGQTKELSDVYKSHLEPLIKSKSTVLLFLQDELSADDLKKYASSFPHLQNVFQSKEYLWLPSVSKEKESINELISGSPGEVEYVDSSSLSDWQYKATSDETAKRIIVFHLEPVRGTSFDGKGKILKSNDLIMHRIIKSLKAEMDDFGIVYSAEDPSPLIANILLEENVNDPGVSSRHILQSTRKNSTAQRFFNNSCVMIFVTSIRHTYMGNTTEFIKPSKTPWKIGGCGSNFFGCCISLDKYGTFGNYENISLLMEFENNTQTQQWHCKELRFHGTFNGSSFDNTFPCGGAVNTSGIDSPVYNTISAPKGMSFACHELTFTAGNDSSLVLGGIQVQTVCDGCPLNRFSPAFHCVGFFTIEIFTAIFVTIILMLGLYVGCMMMMAIQVQDRYDDPKGKTINVTPLAE